MVRKAGLTFAPESADPAIVKAIAKDIDTEVLLKSVKVAFDKAWRSVKLYFMVGFPQSSEGEEDGIVKLSRRVSMLKGTRPKDAAEVRVSVNPFIPKPHTAFQWYGMKGSEELNRKRGKLLSSSNKKVKINVHNVSQSILEGALARGERRVSGAAKSTSTTGRLRSPGALRSLTLRRRSNPFQPQRCSTVGRGLTVTLDSS